MLRTRASGATLLHSHMVGVVVMVVPDENDMGGASRVSHLAGVARVDRLRTDDAIARMM